MLNFHVAVSTIFVLNAIVMYELGICSSIRNIYLLVYIQIRVAIKLKAIAKFN